MRRFVIAALFILPLMGMANAQDATKDAAPDASKPSAEATAAVDKALADAGCKPGALALMPDGSYAADDVECADGKNTVKLDKDYKIVSKTKDK